MKGTERIVEGFSLHLNVTEANKYDISIKLEITKTLVRTMKLNEVRAQIIDFAKSFEFPDHLNKEIDHKFESNYELASIVRYENRKHGEEGKKLKRLNGVLINLQTNDLKDLGKIGQGGFGEVRKVKYKSLYTAIKQIYNYKESLVYDEAILTFKCRNINSITVVGLSNSITERDNYVLAVEFVEGYTLEDYISKNTGKDRDILTLLNFSEQISRGIKFLAMKNIIHRDLKPENILINKYKTVKLIDFGISKAFQKDHNVTQTKQIGTLRYFPPENLAQADSQGEETQEGTTILRNVTLGFDVWSFGLILSNMFSGVQPWGPINDNQLLGKLVTENGSFPIPESITNTLIRFIIKKCTEWNPLNRITISDANDFLKILYIRELFSKYNIAKLGKEKLSFLKTINNFFDVCSKELLKLDSIMSKLSQALYESNFISDSIVFTEKALKKNPNNQQALKLKANTYEKLAEYNKALEIYEKLVKLSKKKEDKVDAYEKTGKCLYRMGSFDLAREQFELAISIDKKAANSLIYIGNVYEDLIDYDSADAKYKEAAKLIRPRNIQSFIEVNKSLARLHTKKGEYMKALDYYLLLKKEVKRLKDTEKINQVDRMIEEMDVNKNILNKHIQSQERIIIQGFNSFVSHLNKQVFVALQDDGKIRLFNYQTNDVLSVLGEENQTVKLLTEINYNFVQHLAIFEESKNIISLWSYQSQKKVEEFECLKNIGILEKLNSLKILDNQFLLELYPKKIILRDLENKKVKLEINHEGDGDQKLVDVHEIYINNKLYLAASDKGGKIYLYDLETKSIFLNLFNNDLLTSHKTIVKNSPTLLASLRQNVHTGKNCLSLCSFTLENTPIIKNYPLNHDFDHFSTLELANKQYLLLIDKVGCLYVWVATNLLLVKIMSFKEPVKFLDIFTLDHSVVIVYRFINSKSKEPYSLFKIPNFEGLICIESYIYKLRLEQQKLKLNINEVVLYSDANIVEYNEILEVARLQKYFTKMKEQQEFLECIETKYPQIRKGEISVKLRSLDEMFYFLFKQIILVDKKDLGLFIVNCFDNNSIGPKSHLQEKVNFNFDLNFTFNNKADLSSYMLQVLQDTGIRVFDYKNFKINSTTFEFPDKALLIEKAIYNLSTSKSFVQGQVVDIIRINCEYRTDITFRTITNTILKYVYEGYTGKRRDIDPEFLGVCFNNEFNSLGFIFKEVKALLLTQYFSKCNDKQKIEPLKKLCKLIKIRSKSYLPYLTLDLENCILCDDGRLSIIDYGVSRLFQILNPKETFVNKAIKSVFSLVTALPSKILSKGNEDNNQKYKSMDIVSQSPPHIEDLRELCTIISEVICEFNILLLGKNVSKPLTGITNKIIGTNVAQYKHKELFDFLNQSLLRMENEMTFSPDNFIENLINILDKTK